MPLTKIIDDLNIISKLPDEPNEDLGLSAAELKAKFDEAGNALKQYLNDTHVPELDVKIAAVDGILSSLQQQIDNLVAISVPDGSITETKLADQSVSHRALGLNAVETANIKNGAVGNAELAANAVAAENIQNDAVTKDKIASKAVGYDELAQDAVRTINIADKNVTAVKIADGAVSKEKLAANAVGTAAIAQSAVTPAKLSSDVVKKFAPAYTASTADLTPGSSALETGKLYIVYE